MTTPKSNKTPDAGTFGAFFAAMLAAVAQARAEHDDDGKITPAEVLDVLVSIMAAVAAMLPQPVRALANLFVSVGRSVVQALGETPGLDSASKANNVVALAVHRETAKLLGNKAEVSPFGRVSTRMRTAKRTDKVPAWMRRGKASD